MKKLLLVLGFASLVFADGMFEGALPENWDADVLASLRYNRNYFSNWVDDGVNSSSWKIQYDADLKGNWKYASWRNLVNLAWGQTYSEGLGTRKSLDKIFLETSGEFNTFGVFKPYAGIRFESQFTTGYTYPDEDENFKKFPSSSFMDPAYITEFVGVAYIPNSNFSQRLAFANRMTISDGYGYADDPDTKKIEVFKNEPGLESVTEFKYNFSDFFSYKTRLWAFTNFKGVKKIDGRFENALHITLTPFIEFSLGIDVAYDYDISENSQYREIMNLGLVWRWF